jgi:hypothetical protein
MGVCASICPKAETPLAKVNPDMSTLFRSENTTAEALLHAQVPPPPLLKEINFAAINEDANNENDTDVDDDELQQLLEEEDKKDH